MPSFDVVSEVDMHELHNAVDQTNREIDTRYDFKGSSARVEQNEAELVVSGDSEFQINQILDILHQRISKRGIDIACLEPGKIEEGTGKARLAITVRQGIDQDQARKLTRLIKDSKIKVQAAVQGEKLRVTGKKRDDLQAVIALLKQADVGLPLQFNNFRD
ncbi:YajQ family cyclic di-GMP-binding protein [Thiorhodospira sibirica]|uniref:YajQ family cyclic di-GMP-binding protein n=1 Tax=Thiorhodospira sibirica TaxID=154347 RepID=UPI00022C171D|nr:YajQ family cyclic di-GMP-binding protein [Thiorhodospira sibirica]